MKAVIIAGGKGERLRPLTNNVPKPMIEVSGKPVLEHVINLFKKYSIKEFVISVCYLQEKITSYFGDGSKFGVKIHYIFENPNNPLGTAGGLTQASKHIDGDFIVTSGDTLRKLDINAMIKHHKRKNAYATINVYKRYGKDPKSMILFNKNYKIYKFVERPQAKDIKDDFVWASGFFFVFKPQIFSYIPKNINSDLGKDVFPLLLKDGKNLYAFPTQDYFIDIGNLEKLEKAKKTFIYG